MRVTRLLPQAFRKEINRQAKRALGNYAVANLPVAGEPGRTAFATDGRKEGQGIGAGTGVLVYDDGTDWKSVDTSATVLA